MEYITADDKIQLEAQLKECVDKRKGLSDRIGRARELGDLRENAEYHAAKEDQGHNEARIRDLEEKLANAVVADTESVPDDIVFVGATVTLREVDSKQESMYRVVGNPSGNIDDDFIEVTPSSPMGIALIKARINEVIRVDLPRGAKRFEIVEITR